VKLLFYCTLTKRPLHELSKCVCVCVCVCVCMCVCVCVGVCVWRERGMAKPSETRRLCAHKLILVVEWLTYLLRIRESRVQISAPTTAILSDVFVVFLSPFRQMSGYYNGHNGRTIKPRQRRRVLSERYLCLVQ
jgi:hypothetical protein